MLDRLKPAVLVGLVCMVVLWVYPEARAIACGADMLPSLWG